MNGPTGAPEPKAASQPRKARVKIGRRHIPLPASRVARIILGSLFILGGLLSFLPILGIWMLPVGVMILSYDIASARRLRRRTEVWWTRRRRANGNGKANGRSARNASTNVPGA